MTALGFEAVTVRYGERAALHEVSVTCEGGEVLAVLGPNGAGKSSLLAVAAGLLRADAGEVRLGEAAATGAPAPTLGYLPQSSAFPGALTVGEVLDFAATARGASEEAVSRVLALAGLEDELGRPLGTLSGGWVRRVGLALALLPPREALLLDEPFVGLDPEVLDALVEHLGEVARGGVPVVLSTHEFESADRLRPRVAVLGEGLLCGTREPGQASCREAYRDLLAARTRAEEAS